MEKMSTLTFPDGSQYEVTDAQARLLLSQLDKKVDDEIAEVNESLVKVKTYVGSDGKLHFVDASGADTVLPFSSSIYENIQIKAGVQVNKTYKLKEGQIIIITSQGNQFSDSTKQPKLYDTSNMRMFTNGHNGSYWFTSGVATNDKTVSLSMFHYNNNTTVEVYVS